MVTGVQATPNLASLSSFPMVALSHVKVDNATINSVCDDFNADNDIDEGDYKKAVFGMLANLCLSVNNFESKLEEVKKDVANNSAKCAVAHARANTGWTRSATIITNGVTDTPSTNW